MFAFHYMRSPLYLKRSLLCLFTYHMSSLSVSCMFWSSACLRKVLVSHYGGSSIVAGMFEYVRRLELRFWQGTAMERISTCTIVVSGW
ncbi:uncharacterized protein P174DRAFT_2938 [Aspergillus novofumigatus IBT 16806]|uniref:Uncharacterized protein n=1 Tax=Aspergillus novofumigatus (strain IBT 16806) TaxID=1392255 RepID=A0A2I1CKB0_ASPN1|nr:uncharacterized protein P174DRAFT_2938 [Aspergillus novofumigatus IBT 16806]PKX98062.1 hypothetical protein P174DRAFT_2938 [Aspergillus novofumigatus IBT 16806]